MRGCAELPILLCFFLLRARHMSRAWMDATAFISADFPSISGLVEERNARGTISIPSQLLIQSHNTYDTIVNGAINPMLHWGDHTIAFSPGLQFTVRRDKDSPVQLNQNLFRQFLYVYSSPFWNWLSFTGDAIHESGPFTEQNLSSRDNSASLNFVVGRPWDKIALITGYQARDVQFHPVISEYYTTSVYAGVRRKFGENLEVSAFAEYLRSWRVQDAFWANAEALRPASPHELHDFKALQCASVRDMVAWRGLSCV